MKKFIVSTTINYPTEALRKFSEMEGWTLVVAGDKETPHESFSPLSCVYLGPEKQENLYPELSRALGWNCVQRRNIAAYYAYEQGADLIALVDDDNIPYDDWGSKLYIGKPTLVKEFKTSLCVFNLLRHLNTAMWHRGYPVELLSMPETINITSATVVPDVQANLWNGSPDVDAICRMTMPTLSNWEIDSPIASDKYAPFNSQNTILTREVLPYYFLFPFIGRIDDIWASYYVQSKGFKVIFDRPTVFQNRNPHDLVKDLELEIYGYRHTLSMIKSLYENSDSIYKFLPESSGRAFSIWKSMFPESA
jgi:hypothetical protein